MKNSFLLFIIIASGLVSIYLTQTEEMLFFSGVSVAIGFLVLALTYLNFNFDLKIKTNQLFVVGMISFAIPALELNINLPTREFINIYNLFFLTGFGLVNLIFWVEENVKHYFKNALAIKLILALLSFVLCYVLVEETFIIKVLYSLVASIWGFNIMLMFQRWKFHSSKSYRYGWLGFISIGVLFFFNLKSNKNIIDNHFPVQVDSIWLFANLLIMNGIMKSKFLPNWMVLKFKQKNKKKMQARMREKRRFKKEMES